MIPKQVANDDKVDNKVIRKELLSLIDDCVKVEDNKFDESGEQCCSRYDNKIERRNKEKFITTIKTCEKKRDRI